MRRLERGASYVPLIIVVVLLIVAIVWAYIKTDEADKLKKDLDVATSKFDTENERGSKMRAYIVELSDMIGFDLTTPTDDKRQEYRIDRDLVREFIDAKLKELRDDMKREFPTGIYDFSNAQQGGIARTEGEMVVVRYIEPGSIPSETTVEAMYGYMSSAMRRMLVDLDGMFTQLRDQKARAATDIAGKDQTIGEKDQEIQRITAEKNSINASLIQKESELNARIQDLEDQKRAVEAELETAQKDLREQVAAKNNQINALQQNIVKLKERKRLREEPIGPDGEVLAVAEGQGVAVINRGKANHLQPGLTFDVYALGKGAQKIYKGVITVLDVGADTAKVRIVSLNNLMNPIVAGDYIESLTYNPNEKLNFVLLGRFKKYGRSDAARRIEQLGQNVQPNVDIDTDYLVIGAPETEEENLEDSAAYRRAKELGIRIITEKQLSTFLLY